MQLNHHREKLGKKLIRRHLRCDTVFHNRLFMSFKHEHDFRAKQSTVDPCTYVKYIFSNAGQLGLHQRQATVERSGGAVDCPQDVIV